MTDREQILGQPCLHLRMQIQQAHCIGDGGAATADLLGNILLSQAKLAGKTGITLCFLDWTEISPLQIFFRESSRTSLSLAMRTMTGTCVSPSCWAARQRRSPAMISCRPLTARTT